VVQGCHDAASRFVYILTKGKRKYLVEDDFVELIQVSIIEYDKPFVVKSRCCLVEYTEVPVVVPGIKIWGFFSNS